MTVWAYLAATMAAVMMVLMATPAVVMLGTMELIVKYVSITARASYCGGSTFNTYHPEIFLYEPWRSKVYFFNLKSA